MATLRKASFWRYAGIGAATLGSFFLITRSTWVAADAPSSQRFLNFFTQQALEGPDSFARGLAIALIVGGALGALVSIILNLVGLLSFWRDRRHPTGDNAMARLPKRHRGPAARPR